MSMTDPIADMLTRIRNANIAMHDQVRMPSSKQKLALAEILRREGYIGPYEVNPAPNGPGNTLTITMKYSPERQRVISGLQRVSKPEVPRVLGGLGISVLSTSQGLITDREARRRRVGGEILCNVW